MHLLTITPAICDLGSSSRLRIRRFHTPRRQRLTDSLHQLRQHLTDSLHQLRQHLMQGHWRPRHRILRLSRRLLHLRLLPDRLQLLLPIALLQLLLM